MDMVREPGEQGGEDDRDGIGGETVAIGTDERRMQVRAYNHWISLLHGRSCPKIDDLDPARIADFGPNSVLLDFTGGDADPEIRFLGHALSAECATDASITRLSQVPPRSLLSRLTDHYLQIIANRAPIGFEAEFVGIRGFPMMYRGILMPFTSNGESIDFLYGVINWKEVVDAATQSQLIAELEESRRAAPRPMLSAGAWADGPSAGLQEVERVAPPPVTLADRLAVAQGHADAARSAGDDSPDALIAALAHCHDLAVAAQEHPAELDALLDDTGPGDDRDAPLLAIVRLVFGGEATTRLTDHALVLAHARRRRTEAGGLPTLIAQTPGGIAALAAAERSARAIAPVFTPTERLRAAVPLAIAPVEPGDDEFVVLLARAVDARSVAILGRATVDAATLAKAIDQVAQES